MPAAEKEPAAHLLVGLVDRDVLAGHSRVPDEKRGRRQSAKSSTNDVRPHRLSPPNSAAALETDHPHQLPPARAASGHTAEPWSSVMNSRRFN